MIYKIDHFFYLMLNKSSNKFIFLAKKRDFSRDSLQKLLWSILAFFILIKVLSVAITHLYFRIMYYFYL